MGIVLRIGGLSTMSDEELAQAFKALRPIVTNIVGFHALSENENIRPSPVAMLNYQAQVYAGGVELARRVLAIADALNESD